MCQSIPTITVIISTFNGEEYIKEQIDSLLRQEGVSVRINVRDDGSDDNTISIINSFNDSRIRVFSSHENLGPARSFLSLLKDCEESSYYAYCDQDDYWKPKKLITAINMLMPASVPWNSSPYQSVPSARRPASSLSA